MLGAPQLRWIEAELLHKVPFGRDGVTKDEFIQTLGEQFGGSQICRGLRRVHHTPRWWSSHSQSERGAIRPGISLARKQ